MSYGTSEYEAIKDYDRDHMEVRRVTFRMTNCVIHMGGDTYKVKDAKCTQVVYDGPIERTAGGERGRGREVP